MKFIGFNQLSFAEWNNIVCNSEDGWAFSLAEWLEMVTPVWGMQNVSFAVYENGKLVAVMPLHWYPTQERLSSGGWGHGGPVIVAKDRQRIWRACWAQAYAIAEELGTTRITASISPICQSSLNNRWGVNPLAEVEFNDTSTHTRIINLSPSVEQLWFSLTKDARQKVRQARSLGYTAQHCFWKDFVDEYYRVHVETYQRTGVQPHPKAYFEGIASQPVEYHVLWCGFDKNGNPVAFHNDARFRMTSLYHTGCSETSHLKSGINYLLFWEAIMGAKADGCLWYETGEAFPAARAGKDKGLTDFKGKFGGELHRVFRGERPVDARLSETDKLTPALTSAAQPSDSKTILHNWLNASRDLSQVIFGEKFTGMIKKLLLGVIHLMEKSDNGR